MTRGEWVAVGVATLGLGGLGVFAFTRPRKSVAPAPAGGDGGADVPTSVAEEVEALARAIASEAGNQPRQIQVAVGWAVLNYSVLIGKTVWATVRGRTGDWGTQSKNGYVSSALAPTSAITELARQIFANEIPDPTDGAVQFDVPKLQRAQHAKDPKGVKTPEQIAQARQADGKVKVLLPGVPEDTFRLWRPA